MCADRFRKGRAEVILLFFLTAWEIPALQNPSVPLFPAALSPPADTHLDLVFTMYCALSGAEAQC